MAILPHFCIYILLYLYFTTILYLCVRVVLVTMSIQPPDKFGYKLFRSNVWRLGADEKRDHNYITFNAFGENCIGQCLFARTINHLQKSGGKGMLHCNNWNSIVILETVFIYTSHDAVLKELCPYVVSDMIQLGQRPQHKIWGMPNGLRLLRLSR